ncbi:HpcH/HpaI aldolase/citrate lyase family protein [Caballeronia sp. LjRoot31]|uniref:HpcH/HpaI aldolase/citrate lyase family protein n=1 Tax=Caballeronia sp. LjRoot31 TaxID=3342324 RepID=UPI003ECFD05F
MGLQQRSGLPFWRSLLFVPVNVEKYVQKASACGADAIILDLEDSVAPADKEAARAQVAAAAERCATAGADILVRVNRPLELAVRDIETVVAPQVSALMLPKVDSAGHVRLLAELVESIERRKGMAVGHTRFYAVVESVTAFAQIFEIAAAHPRIVAFACGAEDFTASCGAQPDPDVLLYPKQQGVLAARAAGVLPLGIFSSSANYRDLDGFRAAVAQARRFGVEGSTCIHPAQVPILNEGFSPGADEIAAAQRIVDTYDEALRSGRGSIGLDGRMLDVPVVERAERILAIAARMRA